MGGVKGRACGRGEAGLEAGLGLARFPSVVGGSSSSSESSERESRSGGTGVDAVSDLSSGSTLPFRWGSESSH